MKRLITICAVFVLVVAATPAAADLTIGPNDGAYYTHQKWSFDTLETLYGSQEWGPLFPEDDNNPYETAVALSVTTSGGATAGTMNSMVVDIGTAGWYAELNGRFGVMHSGPGGTVFAILYIPNFADENMYKIVQIETVYQGSYANLNVMGGEFVNEVTYTTTDEWGNDWTDMTSTWHIDPQPDSEMIFVTWGGSGDVFANVDFIEVATVCVPVPGAVLLGILGLGAVGIKLRKYA